MSQILITTVNCEILSGVSDNFSGPAINMHYLTLKTSWKGVAAN